MSIRQATYEVCYTYVLNKTLTSSEDGLAIMSSWRVISCTVERLYI
jgi:hypothetical protein